MRTSDSINELAAALAKAQGEIQNPAKDQLNPHFKSKYADLAGGLETIRPTLAKHGLSVVQMTACDGEIVTLHSRLLHSSGQWVESSYPVCKLAPHQQMGAAMTYARRYCLFALIGVAGENDEDDGNTAATARRRPGEKTEAERKSSNSLKRDDPEAWPSLEKEVRAAATREALDEIWARRREEVATWPQKWQDEADGLFIDRVEELEKPAGRSTQPYASAAQ